MTGDSRTKAKSGAYGPAGRLAALFIDSKLTPLLVVLALGLGAVAVVLTPREEEPQILLPVVDIFVGLPGASPREVENLITVPLEKRMWEIPGVEYVYSSSMPDLALVTVRFLVGADLEPSLVRVYDRLASGLQLLPEGATLPLIQTRTIDDVPILGLTLSSDRYGGAALRRMGAELRKEISALQDVSSVRILGGQRREVQVELDPQRAAAAQLDPIAVARALEVQNAAVTAGSFAQGNREILVESEARLRSVEEVADLVVGLSDGRPVHLREIADVLDRPERPEAMVYLRTGAGHAGGASGIQPAVTLAIAKRQGADAHRVSRAVLDRVAQLRPHLLPQDVLVTVTRDYGETANEKAQELLLHLVLAILSVSVLIGLFLGWRGALVVFVSVPISFALTLFVYYLFGYTLNRVTLFALIFVTGIVVDDSIIVVENIVRHLAKDDRPMRRVALEAVSEVGNPTILATLTVIASVAPMAFVRGLMGPYMLPMPTGASLAMGFSLLVALVAAPWLALRLLRKSGRAEPAADGEGAIQDSPQDSIHDSRVYRGYRALLRPLLVRPRRAWGVLGLTSLLLLLAIALVPLGLVDVKMLPFDNKSELQIVLDMPEGTSLEHTARVARALSDDLVELPVVRDIELYVGLASPISFNGLVRHYDLRAGSNVADLQVNLVAKGSRSEQSHAIAERVRQAIAATAERFAARVKVVEVPPGPPVLSTLVAEVYGPTEEERLRVAAEVLAIFGTTPGVVDVDWLVEAPQEKVVLRVDGEKAALHGVSAAQVARAVRVALDGEQVGLLHLDREIEPVPIVVLLAGADSSSVSGLGAVRLRSSGGAMVPLSELVVADTTALEPSRHRKNLRPVVYVVGEVAGVAESPVYAILTMSDRIEAIELGSGAVIEQLYRGEPQATESAKVKWDGEWQITYEVFRDLGAAFAVVLLLIYLLIVGWFGSFKVPLVMMIAIPLSLVGVLPGHWLLGAFFTATSMIGFIALAGIMVRNSVLLIDFVQVAIAQGRTLGEAVVEAGAVRLRPILLTAGTVVVGAVVILFDPIFQGLAIALMFGAFASTALTLLVVPVVYFLSERRRYAQPLPESWTAASDGIGSSSEAGH